MISPYNLQDNNSVIIHLKVIPNASKNEICGIIEDQNGQQLIKIKVTAVPDDGKANKALIKFLSKEWDIPPSTIEIISGTTARVKKLLIINNNKKFLKLFENNQLNPSIY